MEMPKPHTHTCTENSIEEYSRSTSLTVFEIHRAASELIPGYLLANMMSPSLWKWREERPMHSGDGSLRGANRRLKDLQRQFHWYTFTNDMSKPGGDYWGLLNFDEEEERLGKTFIQTIRKDYDETLKYLLELDSESQFGQIILQDFYKQGYFPRLRNETIEGMNAFERICPMGKGSGKCVALAMLWASSLAVCARFPLDQIILVANKAHLFVFLDDGQSVNLFNNGKWYNSTRINNESELAVQAKSVATGSDVMFFYIPGKGMCDVYNKHSEVERSTIERIAARCGEFLGAPLMVGDLDEVNFEVNERSLPDPSDFEERKEYQKAVYALADEEPALTYFEHAKYAYRDWINTRPEVFAHAAMRDYEVGQRALSITCLDDALAVVHNLENTESIFGSRDRIALPDETLLFRTGNDRDRALLLYCLLHKSDLPTDNLCIGFGERSSYVNFGDHWIDLSDLSVNGGKPYDVRISFDHCASWTGDRVRKGNREVASIDELLSSLKQVLEIQIADGQRLLQELKVNSLSDLKKAAIEQRIRKINGFGESTERQILDKFDLLAIS